MKKLAAIFLLLIFLFNIGGYRIWYHLQEQRSDERILAILENAAYDDEELVTITIPLSLPYQANWKEFETTDGEIAIEGTIYRYVKRKVQHGELVLMCIPHHDKMQVNTARDDFFKYANDLAGDASNNKPVNPGQSGKTPLSDFYLASIGVVNHFPVPACQNFTFPYQVGHLLSVPHSSPAQPPDFTSC